MPTPYNLPLQPLEEAPVHSDGALSSMFAIASVGIATLTMLETLLPAAAREVERKSQTLADHFTHIIHHAEKQSETTHGLLRYIEALKKNNPGLIPPEEEESISLLNAQLKSEAETFSEATEGVIIAMQFQDRNSQVMENVVGILERYRTMLDDVCTNIESLRHDHDASGERISNAIEHILSSIRLSDIRTCYLDALLKAKVANIDGVGARADDEADEVEIF